MTRTTVDGSGRTGIIGGRGGGRGQYRLRMFRSSEVSHGRCSIGGGHLVACCVSICGIDEPPASPIHTRPLNTTSCTLCNIRTYPNSLCNIGVPCGAPSDWAERACTAVYHRTPFIVHLGTSSRPSLQHVQDIQCIVHSAECRVHTWCMVHASDQYPVKAIMADTPARTIQASISRPTPRTATPYPGAHCRLLVFCLAKDGYVIGGVVVGRRRSQPIQSLLGSQVISWIVILLS